jgi:hypothetical protein
MNLQEIKKLLEKNTKLIIIENDKPIMVISSLNNESNQKELELDKKSIETNIKEEKPDIFQSTEVIAKEELPVDELRLEDLPF